jgi:hypothetical protein
LADIGSPATVFSLDRPGTQGCLREPVEGGYCALLWECDHAHRTDDAALDCARKEFDRRRTEIIANAPPDSWWLAGNNSADERSWDEGGA